MTLGLGGVSVIGIVIVTGTRTGNADRISVLVVLGVAWWIGTSLRERRAYTVELERQAEQLRAVRTELAERAVVAERLRLARELHDVVAHSLAIVALHSSVGAHNAAQRPQDAAEALAAVNAASRSALAELRALLHVLREGGEPDTAPLPTLADLSTLASGAPGAEFTVDGPVDGVPKALSLTAYRIAQAALTNVVKHADPATARAHVSVEPDRVRVTVTNALTPGAAPTRSGAGLAGMRERVEAFGGSLTVGPGPHGWTVEATLPIDGESA
jgi:signal transduction histidine kinase